MKTGIRAAAPLLLSVLTLAGCTHSVNVDLQPRFDPGVSPDDVLATVQPPVTFVRGTFTDRSAGAEEERIAQFKQGIHTYNLFPERPVEEALFDAVQATLEESGQQWLAAGGGDVRVDLELLDLEASRHAGFINVGARSRVQLRAIFVDPETEREIYSNVYTGSDERQQALIGLMGMVRESLNTALGECARSMAGDEALAAAIARH